MSLYPETGSQKVNIAMSASPSSATPSLAAPEIITVESHADQVMCDGGGGPLGHPVVWYAFAGRECVECLYCDRRFVKAKLT